MPTKDDIGNRGESIFRVLITDPYGPGRNSLFRPYHLGEKLPTLDFFNELDRTNSYGLDGKYHERLAR